MALVAGGKTGLRPKKFPIAPKAYLYLLVRSPSKAEAAIYDIKAIVPNQIITSSHSISTISNPSKKPGEQSLPRHPDQKCGDHGTTSWLMANGYDLPSGTNHTGYAFLTNSLLRVLHNNVSNLAPMSASFS